jgi:hypothetical protein
MYKSRFGTQWFVQSTKSCLKYQEFTALEFDLLLIFSYLVVGMSYGPFRKFLELSCTPFQRESYH